MKVSCQWGLSAHQEGAISTVVFLGTLIGANAFGALSDAYGRRVGFFATAIFASTFGLASALAPSYAVRLYGAMRPASKSSRNAVMCVSAKSTTRLKTPTTLQIVRDVSFTVFRS